MLNLLSPCTPSFYKHVGFTWKEEDEDRTSLGSAASLPEADLCMICLCLPFLEFRDTLSPKCPDYMHLSGLPNLRTCGGLVESSMVLQQQEIFVSFSPTHHFSYSSLAPCLPTVSSPGSPFWFLYPSSSPHSQSVLQGFIHNGLSFVPHTKKILSLYTFQENDQPKKFRKKFIIFNGISLPAPARRDLSSQEI